MQTKREMRLRQIHVMYRRVLIRQLGMVEYLSEAVLQEDSPTVPLDRVLDPTVCDVVKARMAVNLEDLQVQLRRLLSELDQVKSPENTG